MIRRNDTKDRHERNDTKGYQARNTAGESNVDEKTGTCRTTIPNSRPTASLTRLRTKMAPEPPSWPKRLNMTKSVARIHPHPHEAFM